MKQVLFLCTGNYYRSRTAEELFNFYARKRELEWLATSRGLRKNMKESPNVGPISPHAITYLDGLGIPVISRSRMPISFLATDADRADLIIAVSREEHQPTMEDRFPELSGRVGYWEVEDTHLVPPTKALPELHRLVERLIEKLETEGV